MVPRGHKTSSGSPLGGSIRNFFLKCKVGLHRISKEALDSESSEEHSVVNSMFESEARKKGLKESISEERNSSTSVPLTREMRLTDEEENEDLDTESIQDSQQCRSTSTKQTYATYDAVQECAKLRAASEEPFSGADQIWKRRRDLWTKSTSQADLQTAQRNRDRFNEISPRHYVRIYHRLVVDGMALKHPVNLQDAMKVINSGWVETQKWERAANGLA